MQNFQQFKFSDLLEFCPFASQSPGIVIRDYDKRMNDSHIERYKNCLKIISER